MMSTPANPSHAVDSQLDAWPPPPPPPPPTKDNDEIRVIQGYLQGALSLPTTVSILAAPIDQSYTTGGAGTASKLWTLWESVNSLARRANYDDSAAQNKLVTLVAALKDRPNPEAPENKANLQKNWIWGEGNIWSDLKIFDPNMRGEWQFPPRSISPETRAVDGCPGWTNLNAFVARLMSVGVRDVQLSKYAIWSLKDALEVEELSAQELDRLLPASTMWIVFAGRHIHSISNAWPIQNQGARGDLGRRGDLWSGKQGFCKERWMLWKERFGMMVDRNDIANETKPFLKRAIEFMDAIERERRLSDSMALAPVTPED